MAPSLPYAQSKNELIEDIYAHFICHVTSLVNRTLHSDIEEKDLFTMPRITLYDVPAYTVSIDLNKKKRKKRKTRKTIAK